MRKLNENARGKEVKYLGEGLVGVYQGGRLVERYQLEKGDNLLEAFGGRKLQERLSYNRKVSSFDGSVDHIWNIPLPEGSPDFHLIMNEYPNGSSAQGFGYGCVLIYVGSKWGDQAIKPQKFSGWNITVEKPQYIAPKDKADYGVRNSQDIDRIIFKIENILRDVDNGVIELTDVNELLPIILRDINPTSGVSFKLYRGKAIRV